MRLQRTHQSFAATSRRISNATPSFFQERITTAVADGAKYSISATCFGNDGHENIYLHYSNAKSGTSHREIML